MSVVVWRDRLSGELYAVDGWSLEGQMWRMKYLDTRHPPNNRLVRVPQFHIEFEAVTVEACPLPSSETQRPS